MAAKEIKYIPCDKKAGGEHEPITVDIKEYTEKIRAKIGEERSKILTNNDLLRIVRGYRTEKERWKKTLEMVNLWLDESVRKGFYTFVSKPRLSEEDFNALAKAMPCYVVGQSKHGYPIIIERVRDYDKEEVERIGMEKAIMYRDYQTCAIWHRNQAESERRGVPQYKHIRIFDFYNIGITNGKKYLDLVKKFVDRDSNLYAEIVYKIYMFNTGWSFSMLWGIAKLFVHEITRKKINVLGGVPTKEFLKEIDLDQLHESLGGKFTKKITGKACFFSKGDAVWKNCPVVPEHMMVGYKGPPPAAGAPIAEGGKLEDKKEESSAPAKIEPETKIEPQV